jgi:hypothetical protein
MTEFIVLATLVLALSSAVGMLGLAMGVWLGVWFALVARADAGAATVDNVSDLVAHVPYGRLHNVVKVRARR